jgi:hypothetical protein
VLLIVPHETPEHPAPERLHVTLEFGEWSTVTQSWTDIPTSSLAVSGVSLTPISGSGVVSFASQEQSDANNKPTHIDRFDRLFISASLLVPSPAGLDTQT